MKFFMSNFEKDPQEHNHESMRRKLQAEVLPVARRVAAALASEDAEFFRTVVVAVLNFDPASMSWEPHDTSIPLDAAILYNVIKEVSRDLNPNLRLRLQACLSTGFLGMTGGMWECALKEN